MIYTEQTKIHVSFPENDFKVFQGDDWKYDFFLSVADEKHSLT